MATHPNRRLPLLFWVVCAIVTGQRRCTRVEVRSGEDLQTHLHAGAAHVTITDHLRMHALPVGPCQFLVCVGEETHPTTQAVSIRGDCEPFQGSLNQVTLPGLHPRQCVITSGLEWLYVWDRHLWLHNVHVVVQASQRPSSWLLRLRAGAQVWCTQVGLQGQGGVGRHVTVASDVPGTLDPVSRLLFADGYLGDTQFEYGGVGVAALHAVVAVHNTTVNSAVSLNDKFRGVLRSYHDSRVLAVNCTFDEASEPHLSTEGGGQVYFDGDEPVWDILGENWTEASPVHEAPADAFLTVNDASLIAIMEAAYGRAGPKTSSLAIVGVAIAGMVFLATGWATYACVERRQPQTAGKTHLSLTLLSKSTLTSMLGSQSVRTVGDESPDAAYTGADNEASKVGKPTLTQTLVTTTAVSTQDLVVYSPRTRTAMVLDSLRAQSIPLYGRFDVTRGRRQGGQALVQFVEDRVTRRQLAAKFFPRRQDFERERELYEVTELSVTMPTLLLAQDEAWPSNADADLGLPPCLVMEQGDSMHEKFRDTEGDVFTTVQALGHVFERLGSLHRKGWVHRDIKPENLLWMPNRHCWCLVDFGCAARIGSRASIAYSLRYAAPEVLNAVERGERNMVVSAAIDIWAVGIIAFELLTGGRVFGPEAPDDAITAAILGREPLPWERDSDSSAVLRKLGVFKRAVLACLQRDPEQRVNCNELFAMWTSIFTPSVSKPATSAL